MGEMSNLDGEKMVYLAHPCTTAGGTIEDNKKHEDQTYLVLLEKYPKVKFVRPLKLIPDGMSHQDAMDRCFKLLSACDGAIFSGDWAKSKGCLMELEYCIRNSMEFNYFNKAW